jgi:4-hydroxy-3-methylbut-2-enyl diphosphate reductase
MEIRIARPAGICYGVGRALRLAREATLNSDGLPVATIGALIHNPQVVSELEREGVKSVDGLADLQQGTLVVRSHGMPPDVIEAASAKGLSVVDATCPYVARVHAAAEEMARAGFYLIIVGEPQHPEVKGILARAGARACVVTSVRDLPSLPPTERVGVVVQTTQTAQSLEDIVTALRAAGFAELRVVNTICAATSRRQQAAVTLARATDVMIVVGGHNSSNTTRLTEVARAANPRTWQVEGPDELRIEWFDQATSVGVTAGASTPESQLQQVVSKIESLPQP